MVFTTIGLVQKYKISIFETKDAEASERFQDYGFASQPSEGEGLVIDAGGSMFVLRVDRLKDRPQLANDEVAVWQKDGAKILLKNNRIIEVDCDEFNVKASKSMGFDTPKINAPNAEMTLKDVSASDKSFLDHTHHENDNNGETDPPT